MASLHWAHRDQEWFAIRSRWCKNGSGARQIEYNRFQLISTFIPPKVLATCYPIHLETVAVIDWNSCVALKCQRENVTDIFKLYNIMIVI